MKNPGNEISLKTRKMFPSGKQNSKIAETLRSVDYIFFSKKTKIFFLLPMELWEFWFYLSHTRNWIPCNVVPTSLESSHHTVLWLYDTRSIEWVLNLVWRITKNKATPFLATLTTTLFSIAYTFLTYRLPVEAKAAGKFNLYIVRIVPSPSRPPETQFSRPPTSFLVSTIISITNWQCYSQCDVTRHNKQIQT